MAASKNNLARKLARTPAFRTFAVSLTPEVADQYIEQAEDRDVGAVLSDRLEDPLVVAHTSSKPLYFSDDQRRELERLLDANVSSAAQVLTKLKSLFTVIRISDGTATEDLTLTPNQTFRLQERANIRAKSVPQLAKELAIDGINREIGLF